MSETAQANPPKSDSAPSANTPPPSSGPIAGRYETPDKFTEGYKSLYKEVTGLDLKGEVFGKDAINPDIAAAEATYKQMRRSISARGKESKEQQQTNSTPAKADTGAPIQISSQPTNVDIDAPYDVGKIVADAGLKMEDIEAQFREHGDLSEDQYAKIRSQRKNLGKADIKLIAEGIAAVREKQNAEVSSRNTKITEMLGGPDKSKTIIEWAKTMPTESIAKIDRLLQDPQLYEVGVEKLLSEYTKANGQPNSGIRGGAQTSIDSSPFTTLAEFKEASDRIARGQAKPGDMERMKAMTHAAMSKLS